MDMTRPAQSLGSGAGNGNGQFDRPFGIGVDQEGNLYVADTNNHRVQVLSSEGTFIKHIGSKGTGPGEFKYPIGITIDQRRRRMIVTDYENQRVQVLDLEGKFLFFLAGNQGGREGQGQGQGEFYLPWGVALSPSGSEIAVADQCNHRVQIFGAEKGEYRRTIGKKGKQPGEFSSPRGVGYLSEDTLVIGDHSNERLQV